MALDPEVEVHEAITTAWIESDSLTIEINRKVRTPTGSGGFSNSEVPLPTQTFRMDRYGGAGALSALVTNDGVSIPKSFRIVGDDEADVEKGDTFKIGGVEYEVIHVHRETFERLAAEVEYRG